MSSDVAEIDAMMIPRKLHPSVYMLERISLPRVAMLIDPDRVGMKFLISSMQQEGEIVQTFDGDLKFQQRLSKAQIQRSTLIVQ